jgi:hypothetical protein
LLRRDITCSETSSTYNHCLVATQLKHQHSSPLLFQDLPSSTPDPYSSTTATMAGYGYGYDVSIVATPPTTTVSSVVTVTPYPYDIVGPIESLGQCSVSSTITPHPLTYHTNNPLSNLSSSNASPTAPVPPTTSPVSARNFKPSVSPAKSAPHAAPPSSHNMVPSKPASVLEHMFPLTLLPHLRALAYQPARLLRLLPFPSPRS